MCIRDSNRTSPCENCVMQRAFVSLQTEQMKFSLDSAHTVEVFATPVVLEEMCIRDSSNIDPETKIANHFESNNRFANYS